MRVVFPWTYRSIRTLIVSMFIPLIIQRNTLNIMDLLHDHLVRARASGAVFARSVALPPWGLTLPGSIQLSCHTALRGHLWLWLDDQAEAVRLLPGDLALVVG